MPLVSVIIPIFNVENYLKKCLKSIINQTLKDIEIICINDGSSDSSLNILNDFASSDERIIVLSQKNHGPAKSRNEGLKIAKGKYIFFVDSDDYIQDYTLEKLYENAKNNEVQSVENGLSVLNEKQENEKNNEIKETEENDNIKAIDEAKKQVTSEEPQKVKSVENASPSKIKQVWSKFKNNKKILSVIGIGIAAIAGLLLAGISIEMILSTSSAVLAGYASGYVAKKSGILK